MLIDVGAKQGLIQGDQLSAIGAMRERFESELKDSTHIFLIGVIALAIFITGERSNFIKGLIYTLILFSILPGEKLFLETKIISFKRGLGLFEGRASVENDLACKAEFKLLLPY